MAFIVVLEGPPGLLSQYEFTRRLLVAVSHYLWQTALTTAHLRLFKWKSLFWEISYNFLNACPLRIAEK